MALMKLQMDNLTKIMQGLSSGPNADDEQNRNETDMNANSGSHRSPEEQEHHEKPPDTTASMGETQEAETMGDVPSQPG